MTISRNWLFFAALGYKVYRDNREPKGVQLNVGPNGISIEK